MKSKKDSRVPKRKKLQRTQLVLSNSQDEERSQQSDDTAATSSSQSRTTRRKRSRAASSEDDDSFAKYFEAQNEDSRSITARSRNKKEQAIVVDLEEEIPQSPANETTPILWSDMYAPSSVADLIISKTKVQEVSKWFDNALHQNRPEQLVTSKFSRLLILQGPPGCGKFSLIQTFAKKHDMQLSIFQEPEYLPYSYMHANTNVGMESIPHVSMMQEFCDFLLEASHYPSLQLDSALVDRFTQKIVIVREVPHADNAEQFTKRANILKHLAAVASSRRGLRFPVVLMHTISDCATEKIDFYKTFPEQLKSVATIITLNGITKREIEKTLKHIFSKQKTIARNLGRLDQEFKLITQQADGDLRQAINQLQFTARKYSKMQHKTLSSKNEKIVAKLKKTSSNRFFEEDKESTETRNLYLDLHHVAGKILYGKRHDNGCLEFDVEQLPTKVHANENIIVSYVQHNMPRFCDDVDDLSKIYEEFSTADILSTVFVPNYVTEQNPFTMYSYSIAARAYVLYNTHPSQRKFKQIYAPPHRKVSVEREKNGHWLSHLFGVNSESLVPLSLLASEQFPFEKMIAVRQSFRRTLVPYTARQVEAFRSLQNFRTRAQVQGSDEFEIVQQQEEETLSEMQHEKEAGQELMLPMEEKLEEIEEYEEE